jgi:hypothetical protein
MYLKEIKVQEMKEIYQILVIKLFLYPEYSKVIRKISLKWVQGECVSKFSGFQLGKLIATLEEVLLAPMYSKLSFNNQASLIRGYVSTITYTRCNYKLSIIHSGNSNQRASSIWDNNYKCLILKYFYLFYTNFLYDSTAWYISA